MVFLFSGIGIGSLLCDALRLEFRTMGLRLVSALGFGLISWTFTVMLIGSAQLLSKPLLLVILVIGAIYSALRLYEWRADWRAKLAAPFNQRPSVLGILLLVLLILILYLALLSALQPEIAFDAKVFHLAAAKRYVEHGGFYNLGVAEGLPSLDFPQYQEYIYTACYQLFGMAGAKMISWSMLLVTVVAIIGLGTEFFGSTLVGIFAAVLFAGTPIVSWSAGTANTDLGQVPFFLLSLYGILRWKNGTERPSWVLFSGIFSGFALGIKPFAFLSCAVLAGVIGAVFLRSRPWSPSARRDLPAKVALTFCYFGVGVLIGVAPSLMRTGLLTGDPIFPIAAGFFHTALWSPEVEKLARLAYTTYGANTSWSAFPIFPWLLTVRVEQYRDVIGPLYLFALPFVLLQAFRKDVLPIFRVFLAILASWSILWFMSGAIEARYAETLFPLLTIMVAFVALAPQGRAFLGIHLQRLLTLLLIVIAAFNVQPLVGFQRGAMLPYVMGVIPYQWSYLYGCEAEDDVQLKYAPMLAWMNVHLDPKRDRVYAVTGDVGYNLYSNIELFDARFAWQQALATWSLESPNAYSRLRALGIDYVLVNAGEEHLLRTAPLGMDLIEIGRTPSPDPGEIDVLYRLGDPASGVSKRRGG